MERIGKLWPERDRGKDGEQWKKRMKKLLAEKNLSGEIPGEEEF